MKHAKRLLCLLLTLVMLLGMMPVVSAASTEEDISLGQKLANEATSLVGKHRDDLGLNGSYDWCARFVTYCASRVGLTAPAGKPKESAYFVEGGAGASPSSIQKDGTAKVYYYYKKGDTVTYKNKDYSWEFVGGDGTTDVQYQMESFNPEYDPMRSYQPKPGDIIYFMKSNMTSWAHVGIVTDYTAGTITFVDGNNHGNGDKWVTASEKRKDQTEKCPHNDSGKSWLGNSCKYVNEFKIKITNPLIMAIAHPFYTTTEGNTYDEALQITSPVDSKTVTYDHSKGLHINWTPVDGAAFYRVSIRDLTDNADQDNLADGNYYVNGEHFPIKHLAYYNIEGEVEHANGTFQNGHDYRIWVGAYDGAGNPISYSDQVEITIEIPQEEEPENPEEELPSDAPSRDIVLILDGSGSMSNSEFSMTKQAAEAFAEQVMVDNSNTNIAVMSFGSSNRLFKINESDSGFYNTLADVKAAIEKGSRDSGSTYMADAMLFAEDLLSDSKADRQIIMLMSDGAAYGASSEAQSYGTDGPFYDYDANIAYNVAKHLVDDNGYDIYTLGFGLYAGGAEEQLLKEIAKLNGCTYQAVSKIEDLIFGFKENAGEIIVSGNQILIVIACPVEVYVSHGGEALSSSPGWPSYITGFGSLSVSDDGEEKTLRLDASNEYNIELFGTGDGTMTVSSKYPGAAKEEVVYKDVPVTGLMNAQFSTTNDENTVMDYDGDGDGEYEDQMHGTKTYKGVVEYSVTYMVDDQVYATDTYAVGDMIAPPEDPVRRGYDFVRWDDLPDTMPAEDIVVTAVWEARRTGASLLDVILAAPVFPFTDVTVADWFYDDVKAAWDNDLIDGVTDTLYKPNDTLTVAQAIKLSAALHQRETIGYVALSNGTGHWYDTYVDYAVRHDIIESKYASYTAAQMNAPVSRAEFVHIFFGAMPRAYYAEINLVADNAIPDVKMNSAYAKEIYTFYRAGILTGNNDAGAFAPYSSIKRSEAAAILTRMYDTDAREYVCLN